MNYSNENNDRIVTNRSNVLKRRKNMNYSNENNDRIVTNRSNFVV